MSKRGNRAELEQAHAEALGRIAELEGQLLNASGRASTMEREVERLRQAFDLSRIDAANLLQNLVAANRTGQEARAAQQGAQLALQRAQAEIRGLKQRDLGDGVQLRNIGGLGGGRYQLLLPYGVVAYETVTSYAEDRGYRTTFEFGMPEEPVGDDQD